MDQELRNKLRNVVTQCRRLLEEECRQALEGKFGIFAKKDQVTADPNAKMAHLSDEEQAARKDILDHYEHIKARGFKPKDALDQLVREIAFTHLNRLCAYKMMEAREVYVGGQKFREAVSRGINSNGLKFYLADHEDDERLYNTGHQDVAYRHFLNWLGGLLSEEIGVLFNPNDPANRLHPRQATLDDVLDLLNGGGIKPEETALRDRWPQIWSQDETIGWVYQYFTPKELRDEARKASQAPRNSYELAFRNQFFTPRYVVEFLTDNTLGRIWYEMRQGQTRLAERCRYLVRQPDEVFFTRMTSAEEQSPSRPTIEAARLLREGTEGTFPQFEAGSESARRMIEMAHTVSAYDRLGDEAFTLWNGENGPKQAERLAELTTQQILDWQFMTCRADRHGGRGEVYSEPWFLAMANEVRRRALAARNPELTAEERLQLPVFVPYRPKKDPREIKLLDPACGSGHFLLYGFDLLLVIYEEAYHDPDLGPALQRDYPTLDALQRDVPRLILAHNLHGIDIDLRATQIAALALWLRCQRAYQEMGLKKDRPRITRSNFVCGEPMPGETAMLKEFVAQLEPKLLGQLVQVVFDKMSLAGEAGSLLKIEEDIRGAVTSARRQWISGPHSIQGRLFDKVEPPVQQQRFDLSGVSDLEFFEQAEIRVVETLQKYAEIAHNDNHLQRQLFSDDAAQGFAFVAMCSHRFDAVLMNPPFGLFPEQLYRWAQTTYPGGHNDIYAAFVMRGVSFCAERGKLGVISSNSFLRGKQLERLRSDLLQDRLTAVCDLGLNVMDDAWVESAAYILSEGMAGDIVFIDVRDALDKSDAILVSFSQDRSTECFYVHPRNAFSNVPRNAFLYDMDVAQLSLVGTEESLDPVACTARSGLRTFDNDRFVRIWWECSPEDIGEERRWVFFSKGGEFELFYQPLTLVVDWGPNGRALMDKNREVNGQTAQARQGSSLYFKPGLTFPSRSELGFCARLFPEGCIFSSNGPVIIPNSEVSLPFLAGVMNSSRIRQLLDTQSHRRSYSPGLIRRVNWIDVSDSVQGNVTHAAAEAMTVKSKFYSGDETCPEFSLPVWLQANRLPENFRDLVTIIDGQITETRRVTRSALERVDVELSCAYGHAEAGQNVDRLTITWGSDPKSAAMQMFSYLAGAAFGRWDLRATKVMDRVQGRASLSAAIPSSPPGMCSTTHESETESCFDKYPIHVSSVGILVDDEHHPEDIVRMVRDALEALWGSQGSAIDNEACKVLGVKDLREFFRKPSKGGFWEDHISRYTKSRRKAPIYWLLQSYKKNYSLWLYYQRLDKDILFKALTSYVEPKIRLEAERLQALMSQKLQAGDSGKEAKRLAKEVEKQEDFLSELRDFEDKLRRAANLNLEPDLNDGVVLNIAPLRELVPWNEAKAYWEELLEGKYEWSSIGKQLRQKGLVT